MHIEVVAQLQMHSQFSHLVDCASKHKAATHSVKHIVGFSKLMNKDGGHKSEECRIGSTIPHTSLRQILFLVFPDYSSILVYTLPVDLFEYDLMNMPPWTHTSHHKPISLPPSLSCNSMLGVSYLSESPLQTSMTALASGDVKNNVVMSLM